MDFDRPLSPQQIRLHALIQQHKPKPRKRQEGQLKTRLLDVAAHFRARLWVNTVGLFYNRVGTPVQCGLAKSSSDLIGYRIVTVTPAMVGTQIAQFCCAEVKKPGCDTTDPEHLARQERWIAAVVADGGIGAIVRSEAELIALLK